MAQHRSEGRRRPESWALGATSKGNICNQARSSGEKGELGPIGKTHPPEGAVAFSKNPLHPLCLCEWCLDLSLEHPSKEGKPAPILLTGTQGAEGFLQGQSWVGSRVPGIPSPIASPTLR